MNPGYLPRGTIAAWRCVRMGVTHPDHPDQTGDLMQARETGSYQLWVHDEARDSYTRLTVPHRWAVQTAAGESRP